MGSDSGTGKSAESGPNFFDNLAEDLRSIANGTASPLGSAYDVHNAEAMAANAHANGNPKAKVTDYLRGGASGPGGPVYSASALHAAGIAARAEQTAHSDTNRANRQAASNRNADTNTQGMLGVKDVPAPANVETSGMLTTKSKVQSFTAAMTQSKPAVQSKPVVQDEPLDENPTFTPSSGPKTRSAATTPASSDASVMPSKAAPGADPRWAPSATPAQQARNIDQARKEQARKDQGRQQAQDRKAAFDAISKQTWHNAGSRTPAPQRAPQRTPDQKATDVGEQPLSGSVGPNGQNTPADISRVQRALVQNGTMKPTSATGYIGTQTLDDIKAFQANRGLVVDGLINPNGPTAAALMDGTIDQWRAEQKPKAFGKGVQVAFAPALTLAGPALSDIALTSAVAGLSLLGANEASKALRDWLAEEDPLNAPLPGYEPSDNPNVNVKGYPQQRPQFGDGIFSNPEPTIKDKSLLDRPTISPDQRETFAQPQINEARSRDLEQIDHLADRHDLDRRKAGKVLEKLKKGVGMKGESATVDPTTGEVYDPITGESLGNIIDELQ